MCDHCGCSTPSHPHAHGHGSHSHHDHGDEAKTIEVHASLLARNQRLADQNRGLFRAAGLGVLNLVSSPGSGKTLLIERTVRDLAGRLRAGVIVGDLATENDANRLRQHGVPAVQVTTGTVCHLDAHMVQHALEDLPLKGLDLVFIENVGNLVCPAAFDLGEDQRVVVMSVTEGEDKPLKYPSIFVNASVVLVNKCDLADAAQFARDAALANIRKAAPRAAILEVSAKTGAGMEAWYGHLEGLCRDKRARALA
jgi:hydrogenase nickel incorporation protein HypB